MSILESSKDPDKMLIMQHFIRVYNDLRKNTIFLVIISCDPGPMTPQYTLWTIPSLLYQTRTKNPIVHNGLKPL